MRNAHLVFLTADTDCDGTLIAAHRATVPAHRVGEFVSGDADHLARFMLGGDLRMAQYASEAYRIMTEAEFRREFFPGLPAWDRGYWLTDGYARVSESWNPWVYDDSIGIPALDHTLDF